MPIVRNEAAELDITAIEAAQELLHSTDVRRVLVEALRMYSARTLGKDRRIANEIAELLAD